MEEENKKDSKQQQIEQKIQDKQNAKKARVVIRNLVFDINEKHIRTLLVKYGKLTEVSIPLNPSTGKARGFAFAQFENKNMALKAVKELNGSKYKGRNIILDMAIQKEVFTKSKEPKEEETKIEEEGDEKEEEQEEKEEKVEEEIQEEEQKKTSKKDKKKQEVNKKEQEKKKEDVSDTESDFSINSKQDDREELSDSDDESEIVGNKNFQKQQEESEESEEEEEVKPKVQKKDFTKNNNNDVNKKQKKEDLGCTIFVRNLSFQTTQQDFEDFFKAFGELEFAKVVINRETGDNKGTGFVKFKDIKIAEKLIQATSDFDNRTSVLDEPIDLELNNRRLICLQGLKKEEAAEKTHSYDKANKNKLDVKKVKNLDEIVGIDRAGKRNLKLSKLGTFDVSHGKNDFETDRRAKHLKEKIEKLKNPNNVVSSTRVAFKHLPKKNFEEQNIKSMIIKSLMNKDEKLTPKEISKDKVIRQMSFLRDAERGNVSRGIAFVEFSEQKYAENFLRDIQTNIDQFRKDCQNTLPIVEFAIEDIRKIQKIQKIRDSRKEKLEEQKETQNDEVSRQTRKEKVKNIKSQQQASKLQLNQLLGDKEADLCEENYKKSLELLEGVKSRGSKQRLKQKLDKKFQIKTQSQEQQLTEKKDSKMAKNMVLTEKKGKNALQKEQYKAKQALIKQKEEIEDQMEKSSKKNNKIEKKTDEQKAINKIKHENLMKKQKSEKKLLNTIQKGINNKRKAKFDADQYDDLDEKTNKHINKYQKKLKWDK